MKLSKSEFKSILKECLQELIEEGILADTVKEVIKESFSESETFNSELKGLNNKKPFIKESIKQSSQQPKQTDLFQSILEDTAATTLRQQALGEKHPQMNPAMLNEMTNQSSNVDLDKIKPSGQEMSHWAKLAFNKK